MNQFLTALKALAEETRLKLLNLLLTQDLCGKALAHRLGISEAAVSQHLKILKEAGLVDGGKRGYWNHYSVENKRLEGIVQEFLMMAHQSASSSSHCRRIQAEKKALKGKEIRTMCCAPCCERPIKLKEKPEKCSPEQIKQCHGHEKDHPCVPKKEGK
jgi:ArsR family transcriptional regulator